MSIAQRVCFGLGASLLAAACSMDEAGETLEQTELAATAPTQIGGYALMASGHATFKDRSLISGGHVGVAPGSGDSVTAGFDSKIALGKATLGQRVVLKDRAALGDLFATTVVGALGTYTSRSPYAAPPAQPVVPTFSAGTSTVTVNSPTTLAAGNYGNITVNSTLTLSGGAYQVQNLTLNVNSIVQPSAATVLRVAGKITGSNHVRLGSSATSAAGNLRIEVAGATDATGGIVLGTDSTLTALVLSRSAVSVNDRFIGAGVIAARDITLGIDARFTYAVGFECNTNASCEDGNSCTTDTCADMRCVHTTAANGTACPDDGNACTRDACSNGTCAHPATPDGAACADDGNDCTADACSNGTCLHPDLTNGSPCGEDGDACTTDECTGGLCHHPAAPLGSPCGEQMECDPDGLCVPWECAVSSDCDDGNPCTSESCQLHQCFRGTRPEGSACGDRQACDNAATCLPVDCNTDADCDDANECTVETCVANACDRAPIGGSGSCDNSHGVCDENNVCVPSECGTNIDCEDNNECTDNFCRHFQCSFEPIGGSGSCDNNHGICDENNVCVPSECGTNIDCEDNNECTDNFCRHFQCSFEPIGGSGSCDNNHGVCDENNVCVPGECGSNINCEDNNPCTLERCIHFICSNQPLEVGTPCGDGQVCNSVGICVAAE